MREFNQKLMHDPRIDFSLVRERVCLRLQQPCSFFLLSFHHVSCCFKIPWRIP